MVRSRFTCPSCRCCTCDLALCCFGKPVCVPLLLLTYHARHARRPHVERSTSRRGWPITTVWSIWRVEIQLKAMSVLQASRWKDLESLSPWQMGPTRQRRDIPYRSIIMSTTTIVHGPIVCWCVVSFEPNHFVAVVLIN